MPPQDTNNSNQPGQFDFIMKDAPKAPKQYPWSSLPKPALIIASLSIILIVGILLFSLISGSRVTIADQLIDVMARAQEISRVSDSAVTGASSDSTKSLAKTTSSTLNSQRIQMTKYLTSHAVKVNPKKLASHLSKTTDTQLQTATQNNTFDQTYLTYLKTNLSDYNSAVNTIYPKASKTLQPILKDDYSSVGQILLSPDLK